MPDIRSVADLFEALGRDPGELIGLNETDWLDFKHTTYRLDEDREKWGLAKDVISIAMTGNPGLIVIGVETEVGVENADEWARSLRPVREGDVLPGRIQETIHSWVYPRLDVEITSHPVDETAGLLWTILVPAQRDRDMPFMVVGESTGGRGINRRAFSVYQRTGSQNVPYPPQQLHQWLHEGWRGTQDLELVRAVGETIRAQADSYLADDIISLAAGGLLNEDDAYYYIQAAPSEPEVVTRFYPGARDPLFDRMIRLNQLRGGGFNLPDGREPTRTDWDGLRTASTPAASLSVSRSGIATIVAGQAFMTHATAQYVRGGEEEWINPMTIVELTLEFWRFFIGEIRPRIESNVDIIWRCGMRQVEPPPIGLFLPFDTRAYGFLPFEDATPGRSFDTDWFDARTDDPEVLAFQTLASTYPQFGKDPDSIPFADGSRVLTTRITGQ